MEEVMTNEQMYTMLRMIIEILEGCKDLEEAKGKIKDFVDQARTSKQALKDYKTVVQALIRKVKSAGEREPQL